VARILIVGGGCLGRRLATEMAGRGHALRVTTRSEHGRAGIEATGAECWIGTPDRLATLRGALDNVTVACWMLAAAAGDPEQVAALHASRLEFFLGQAIDTTVRGIVYDAWRPRRSAVSVAALAHGAELVRSLTQLNAIPSIVLASATAGTGTAGETVRASAAGARGDAGEASGDVADDDAWIAATVTAIDSLLGVSGR
jgi:nucleoside-diphosphate-sugar epimerase